MKTALFVALGIFTGTYVTIWALSVIRAKRKGEAPDLRDGAIGLVTNFFDTLGIGSYATTTSFFKLWRVVRDEQIPGTLNVGHTLPSVLQAFIYIAVIQVDLTTLALMIGASVVGSWLGAGVVARWPRRKIQIGMGLALLATSGIMLMSQLHLLPGGGYLMGMNPKAAFPIMMGSCAFLMPVGSVRFIREKSYNLKSALGLAIGGIPGVLLAAFLVRSLPLGAVRWLVVAVVVYTALMMLRSAAIEQSRAA